MPCSYCRAPNHTITHCNHPSIDHWYNTIKVYYQRSLNFIMFLSLVERLGATRIKAVSVKYIRHRHSRPVDEHITGLWGHFEHLERQEAQPAPSPTVNHQASPAVRTVPETITISISSFLEQVNNMFSLNITESELLRHEINQLPRQQQLHTVANAVDGEQLTLQQQQQRRRQSIAHIQQNILFQNQQQQQQQQQQQRTTVQIAINPNSFNKMLLETECGICLETVNTNDTVILPCQHQFCASCVNNQMKIQRKNCCALCRQTFKNVIIQSPKTIGSLDIF